LKKLFIFILIFIQFSIITANEDSSFDYDLSLLTAQIVPFTHLDLMLQDRLYSYAQGMEDMRKLSLNLDPYYKDKLYKKYAQNAWLEAGLNLFGGGMGSIIEGNFERGIPLQILFALGYGGIVYSEFIDDPDLKLQVRSVSFGISGGAIIMGISLPFFFDRNENAQIRNALEWWE
jgi:hypothetical protein